ncbi:MAG: hypothetical protein MI746_10375 [Pseudomonadales bacterium]|nr:hypothetical protein [Pseudomonadales bacterium]
MSPRVLVKLPRRILAVVLLSMLLQGCVVGNVVGTAIGATVEVIKVPFRVVGAAVDVIIPGGD